MKRAPAYDPDYITRHPYATLVGDEYKMGARYRIVREAGTGDYLLILTRGGCGRWFGRLALPPDTLFLIRPGTPHDYGTDRAAGKWDFIWLHFHAPVDWLPFLIFDEVAPGAMLVDLAKIAPIERRRVCALVKDALLRTRRGTTLDRAFAMNALENVILRLAEAARNEDIRDAAFADTFMSYVRDHLKERLTVEALAAHMGLSPSRFAHKFKEAFGTSPLAYIERHRLDYAKRLLETTTDRVKEAAYEAGFPDALYFSKRFRNAYGLTPSEVIRRGAAE